RDIHARFPAAPPSSGRQRAVPAANLPRAGRPCIADRLKTEACQRVQERFPAVPPGKRGHEANFCLSLRGAKRRGNPFSCGSAKRNAVLFGKFGKAADSPKVQLICYVSLRGRGLPHLVAPKSAMLPTGRRPEQGNAPLWLLSPQRVPLCGAPPSTGSQ